MHIARVIAVAISASLLVTAGSAAADGTPAKRPAAKIAKPKKSAKPAPPPEPEPPPAPEPAPVKADEPPKAPETKAADSTPPVATPKKDDAPKSDDKDFDASDKPISVAPLFGFGTGFTRLGIGIRAGYNITENLYVGGQFMYHFGYSYAGYYGLTGLGSDYSTSLFYPSGEFGYDIKAARGRLDIRPYAGVALLVAHVSGPDIGGKSTSASDTALGVYPGVAITYDIPKAPVYVGGDARLLFSLNGGDPSFGAFATAGLRF